MWAGGPTVELNTGTKMPLMGYGTRMDTFEPDFAATVQAIQTALEVGFRHIDTAHVFGTERMVGEAIRRSGIPRDQIFITTKLWVTSSRREAVLPALKDSLKELGIDYVDLYLIHWPIALQPGPLKFPRDERKKLIYDNVDYLDTWKGMEESFNLGLTKAIGVSNFNMRQLQRILDYGTVPPANNQIESNPYFTNTKLIKWCQSKGIAITAHTPLAYAKNQPELPSIHIDPFIKEIALEHNCSPVQAVLRFQIDRNVCVLPRSTKKERIIENFQALNVRLTQEGWKKIEKLNRNFRVYNAFAGHPEYPFAEEL